MAVRSFVLFSAARSGSTTLARILDAHPQLTCWDEPFNSDNATSYCAKVMDLASLATTLNDIFATHTGIKHVAGPDGWPFSAWIKDQRCWSPLNRHLLTCEDHNVILLTRSNLFERALSVEIAQQTGVWHYWTEAHVDLVRRHVFRPADIDLLRRRIDADRQFIIQCRSLLRQRANPGIELVYEDLFGPRVTLEQQLALLNSVLGYLGADLLEGALIQAVTAMLDPTANMTATNSRNLYGLIPNFDAVEAALNDASVVAIDAYPRTGEDSRAR